MMQTFKGVIDDAAKMCGGQNALARHLEIDTGWLSAAKSGKRVIPKEKLAVLACLVEMDPAQLWELQEIANLPRRNPFLQAASAVLSAFLCVVLSVTGNDANAVAIGANSKIPQTSEYQLLPPVLPTLVPPSARGLASMNSISEPRPADERNVLSPMPVMDE